MSPVKTPLLDRVRLPADMRNFSPDQLRQLADELRPDTITAVPVTGGHLGPSLGVVELTLAIHALLQPPPARRRRTGEGGPSIRHGTWEKAFKYFRTC